MSVQAKFAHVNIITQDWKKLTAFYEAVFGCQPVPPERDLGGQWLEDATGVPGASVRGMHLRLPAWGENGPTLEIFEYNCYKQRPMPAANRPGLAHLAFAVDDVQAALDAVLAAGGGVLGKVVTLDIPNAGQITLVYATDPDGNIVELQQWHA